MHRIGIMQGRLTPAGGGPVQSFPARGWREEFPAARRAGLCCIEWIYEKGTEDANPLGTDQGIAGILALSRTHGVSVESICADYYMAERLIRPDGSTDRQAAAHLAWLVRRAALLGARYIVLPFVDSSALSGEGQVRGIGEFLRGFLPGVEGGGVELHLETDLPPRVLGDLLAGVGHPLLRANYDIGNSASLGRDPEEEFHHIGEFLGSVHVKDRVRGGGTVPLGTGDADFAACFRLIGRTRVRGPYILQAARDPSMGEVGLAVRNREFVEGFLAGTEGR
jgi:L-ribulose-5-phosphate 3-epimerase